MLSTSTSYWALLQRTSRPFLLERRPKNEETRDCLVIRLEFWSLEEVDGGVWSVQHWRSPIPSREGALSFSIADEHFAGLFVISRFENVDGREDGTRSYRRWKSLCHTFASIRHELEVP